MRFSLWLRHGSAHAEPHCGGSCAGGALKSSTRTTLQRASRLRSAHRQKAQIPRTFRTPIALLACSLRLTVWRVISTPCGGCFLAYPLAYFAAESCRPLGRSMPSRARAPASPRPPPQAGCLCSLRSHAPPACAIITPAAGFYNYARSVCARPHGH